MLLFKAVSKYFRTSWQLSFRILPLQKVVSSEMVRVLMTRLVATKMLSMERNSGKAKATPLPTATMENSHGTLVRPHLTAQHPTGRMGTTEAAKSWFSTRVCREVGARICTILSI